MVQHVDRVTRARNKGHVGHSGDGDTVALESRRARTLAARKARASKRLQQAVTAVAEQIEAIGAPSPTLDQLASRVQRLEQLLQPLQAEISALRAQVSATRQPRASGSQQQYPANTPIYPPGIDSHHQRIMQAHHAARVKGLTRQLLLKADGQLTAAMVGQLFQEPVLQHVAQGVLWGQPRGGQCILSCKDELHRQQVLQALKKHLRATQPTWRVSCWLSMLQRQNKDHVYTISRVSQQQVTTVDWGDRVAFFRAPQPDGTRGRTERLVIDLGQPPRAVAGQIRAQWSRWGLSLPPPPGMPPPSRQRRTTQPTTQLPPLPTARQPPIAPPPGLSQLPPPPPPRSPSPSRLQPQPPTSAQMEVDHQQQAPPLLQGQEMAIDGAGTSLPAADTAPGDAIMDGEGSHLA